MQKEPGRDIGTQRTNEPGRRGRSMKEMSPEEAREAAKTNVAKGVAAASGSMEGYVDYTDPKAIGQAARKTAKTVRNTGEAIRDERRQGLPGEPVMQGGGSSPNPKTKPMGTREHLRSKAGEAGQGMKERGEELKEGARERAQEARVKAKEARRNVQRRAREGVEQTKKMMREKSPQEIRQTMRNRVGRAAARVTGSAEGIADELDEDLPARAVHKTGEAFREAGSAFREEAQKMRSGGSQETGELSEDVERESIGQPEGPVGDERYGGRPKTYEGADLETAHELERTERGQQRK